MFLLEKKHPIETDIIVDILKSERIPYKLKAIKQEYYFIPSKILGYDIEIYSDLEHFDFAKILINQRLNNIGMLEVAFDKPSVDKMGNPIIPHTNNLNEHLQEMLNQNVKKQILVKIEEPKKSLLKRFIDWIKNV